MIQSRLTSIGKIFIALAALFYAAAITSQSGLLLLLIGLIGGCLVANWFYSRNVLKGLRVQAPRSEFICEGASPQLPWQISNQGKRDAEQVDLNSRAGRICRLKRLIAAETVPALPEVVYGRRGVYPNQELRLTTAAPFGLICSTRKLEEPGEVVVYPKVYEAPAPAVSGLDMMAGGKLTGKRRVTSGAHFAGVRAWQPGDPIRGIHWKSSARGPDLMVKTFDEELAGRVAVILSCDGSEPETVDDAVRAAGSIILAALNGGHQVSIWDITNQTFRNLPPFSDGAEILHELARFEPLPIRNWDLVLEKLPRRSAVALVATAPSAEEHGFLRECSLRNRKSSLYIPVGIPASEEADYLFRFDTGKIWSLSRQTEALA